MSIVLRADQKQVISDVKKSLEKHRRTIIRMATGSGKCHPDGQKIMMSSGRVQTVESLCVGDCLMGIDGFPREIMSISTGYGNIVEIIPTKGQSWKCNDEHVLTLVRTGECKSQNKRNGEIVDVSVNDYLMWSKYRKHIHKLLRVSVPFSAKNLLIDPYFLGILLGDGCLLRGRISITNPEPEIKKEIYKHAKKWKVGIRECDSDGQRCISYYFTNGRGAKEGSNLLLNALRKESLMEKRSGDKFIPFAYKTGSVEQRREVLAGLIDTDGHICRGSCDYISKSNALSDDIAFVARSLGLAAYVTESIKSCNGTSGVYYRVSISGDLSLIPMRVARKKCLPRKQKKDVLRTGFTIKNCGQALYYGFTLKDEHHYLLSDFTVTHNTIVAGYIARRFVVKHDDKRGAVGLFLVHRKRLISQTVSKLKEFGFEDNEIGIIGAGFPQSPWATMQVAMIQTLARRDFPIDPKFVVIDECHHCRASQYEKVIERYPNAYLIGLSATPARLDGKGLGHIFRDIVEGVPEHELIERGALAPYKIAYLPASVDMSGVRKSMGDYSKKQMADRVTDKVIAGVARNYHNLAAGRPAIFFGVSIHHSKSVAEALRAKGYRARHVDHTMSNVDQEIIFRNFQDGLLDVICNVELFTEGIDAPRCEVVMLGRLTSSIVLYRQMCGRAFRPLAGKEALILDLAGCFFEHGYPDEPVNWSLDDGVEVEFSGNKPASKIRICRNEACSEIYARTLPECPSCGNVPPIKTASEVEIDLEIGNSNQDSVIRRKRGGTKLTNTEWKRVTESGGSLECLQNIGKSRGFKPGWAYSMKKYYQTFFKNQK